MFLKSSISTAAVCLCLALSTGTSFAANSCAAGNTLKDGILTIATGNPSYFPWVIDNDPASGKGFEAAVAYEVASRMGFEQDKVEWTTASFDASIQPGDH
jgi:polar amino acid transport system substrate-binding protein